MIATLRTISRPFFLWAVFVATGELPLKQQRGGGGFVSPGLGLAGSPVSEVVRPKRYFTDLPRPPPPRRRPGGLPDFVAEVAAGDHSVDVQIDVRALGTVQQQRVAQAVGAARGNALGELLVLRLREDGRWTWGGRGQTCHWRPPAQT